MKRYCMVTLLTGLFIGYQGLGQAAPVPPKGTIMFAQKMDDQQTPGGKTCSITVEVNKPVTENMSDTACGNDVVSFFRFNNIPSSTLVKLSADKDCKHSDWIFIVAAIKEPATTTWVRIPDLQGFLNGSIVVPGMMLDTNGYIEGNIEGKLSCVQIYPALTQPNP